MQTAGFPPVASPSARVLVLGTLPGRASVLQGEYYAQPRNAFWKIMGELFGAHPDISYAKRLKLLQKHRVAVWDVCASAYRPGSLDARIDSASIRPNDFRKFFRRHTRIQLICFNGAKASSLYRGLVLPTLPDAVQRIPTQVLPSTSPVHAGMPFAKKLAFWSVLCGLVES